MAAARSAMAAVIWLAIVVRRLGLGLRPRAQAVELQGMKKSCATCGVKRTYSDVARSAPENAPRDGGRSPQSGETRGAAPPPKAGQSTRDQLTAITTKLVEAQQQVVQQAPPPAAPAEPGDTKATLAQIKKLEGSLAEILEDEETLKEAILQRIAAKKQLLAAGKPVGARVDQARAALTRAQGRQADAQAAIDAAVALKQVADAEAVQYAKEVADLEQQLVHAPPPPAPELAEAPVAQVQRLLSGMISELRDDEYVDPAHVEAATQHCQRLVEGFTGKQPLGPPPASTYIRMNGKQPPKRLITDHFRVIKTVAKVPSKARAGAGSTDPSPE
ncbi:unnamed protein product [Prorocentrum cordatum]|uniref:Uncharacterized protein n=1 Tax=Prorocentrum cordatum TaxID=2364126 RepID=A0ABN9U7R6_9DINO|nr:unnamed protein product [Polarella glacialis]